MQEYAERGLADPRFDIGVIGVCGSVFRSKAAPAS